MTVTVQPSAAGVRNAKLHQSGGSGLRQSTYGTGGTTVSGTTGAHPKVDSLLQDGPGMLATGIITAMSSDTSTINGIGSSEANGSSMVRLFLSHQAHQSCNRSADHSTS